MLNLLYAAGVVSVRGPRSGVAGVLLPIDRTLLPSNGWNWKTVPLLAALVNGPDDRPMGWTVPLLSRAPLANQAVACSSNFWPTLGDVASKTTSRLKPVRANGCAAA